VKLSAGFLAVALSISAILAAAVASAAPLREEQVVAAVVEVNPRARAARARWQSATHTVMQTLAPADPILGFSSIDSPTNGFTDASAHTLAVSQPFQFPGKAILQHRNAQRAAQIAVHRAEKRLILSQRRFRAINRQRCSTHTRLRPPSGGVFIT